MDARFMRAALDEARRGIGRTAPNPPVGAVVVKDNEIVGTGHHARAGSPHAEPVALDDAGELARGADLYVTLEPCCHHGRTPPCTERVIAAGVRRVFYAVGDSDGDGGGGHSVLEQAGIEAHGGLLQDEVAPIYAPFRWHRQSGTPYGILKMAMTLDGKIGGAKPRQQWLTGDESREYVHRLRNECDAVMVGAETLRVDDPRLNCRLPEGRDPLRIVVTSSGVLPAGATAVSAGCLIATIDRVPEAGLRAMADAGAETLILPSADGRVDLNGLWEALGQRGLLSVLIEGGPTLAASALEAGIVNKLALLYAPRIVGGATARGAFGGSSAKSLGEAMKATVESVRMLGPDILIEAYPCSPD